MTRFVNEIKCFTFELFTEWVLHSRLNDSRKFSIIHPILMHLPFSLRDKYTRYENNYLNGTYFIDESFSTSTQIIAIYWIFMCFSIPFMGTYEIGRNKTCAHIRCFHAISPRISFHSSPFLVDAMISRKNEKYFLWFLVIMSWRFLRSWILCTFFTASRVTCKLLFVSTTHRPSDKGEKSCKNRFTPRRKFHHKNSNQEIHHYSTGRGPAGRSD